MQQPSKPISFRAASHEPDAEFHSAPNGELASPTATPTAASRRISLALALKDLSDIDSTLQRPTPLSSHELTDVLGRIGRLQQQITEARAALEKDYQASLHNPADTLGAHEITPLVMKNIAKFASANIRRTLRATSRDFRNVVGPVTSARAERPDEVPWLIKDLPQLKKLDLRDCLDILPNPHFTGQHEATRAALKALGQATQLEEIKLPLCRGNAAQLRPVYAALAGLKQLTRLTADNPAERNLSSLLPDEIVALIVRHHPRLTELPGLRLATREGVAQLTQLEHLAHLTLELSRPDRTQLDTLAQVVSKLETLRLRLDATALGRQDFNTLFQALPFHRNLLLELRFPRQEIREELLRRGCLSVSAGYMQGFLSQT